jgi:hypothetical protein
MPSLSQLAQQLDYRTSSHQLSPLPPRHFKQAKTQANKQPQEANSTPTFIYIKHAFP